MVSLAIRGGGGVGLYISNSEYQNLCVRPQLGYKH